MSLVFATTFFFWGFFFCCFFKLGGGGGGGGGGGVLRHSAVQTDFEFEISGPLVLTCNTFEQRHEKICLRGF